MTSSSAMAETARSMLRYSNRGVGLYSILPKTATILHQWIGEQFPVFIIDNFTVFAIFYVEGIAGGNVSSW